MGYKIKEGKMELVIEQGLEGSVQKNSTEEMFGRMLGENSQP